MTSSLSPNSGFVRSTSDKSGAKAAPPRVLERLAASAGVTFDGDRPWDIQVHDAELYRRILRQGSLGFGEAYMDGLWDSQRPDETMTRLIRVSAGERLPGLAAVHNALAYVDDLLRNRQTRRRAFQVGERHYDIGNDIYRAMLDPTMSYSCGYWQDADTLEQAQRAKLDLICRKLELTPGERLLDIGCGWGGLAEHAARHYGVEVFGITISREQLDLARERCRGLPVEIRLMDYRELSGRFDKIVSVGMFEHVGLKNYPVYFRAAADVLADQGLMLLHTIGSRASNRGTDPWVDKYIFPNGAIPSVRQIGAAFEPWLVLEDWHCFGLDYDRTLQAWWANFDAAWPTLQGDRYDPHFYRMWKYYLHLFMGYFRSRRGQLWQLVLSRPTRSGVYRSLR
jgi:cyclopropane-fatty-acyl-phospholipid synthase